MAVHVVPNQSVSFAVVTPLAILGDIGAAVAAIPCPAARVDTQEETFLRAQPVAARIARPLQLPAGHRQPGSAMRVAIREPKRPVDCLPHPHTVLLLPPLAPRLS